MPDRRVFLNWDRPCLHAVVDYLHDTYRKSTETWDMSAALCVTQGARAGRRLVELLAERTETENAKAGIHIVMTPPQTVTVGHLPEMLYPPTSRAASNLEMLFARIDALRQNCESISDLLPNTPESDDLTAWQQVAKELGSLSNDLQGEHVDYVSVIVACKSLGIDDSKRWNAIEQVDNACKEVLHSAWLRSAHEYRLQALNGDINSDSDIVLIAAIDMPRIIRQFINKTSATVTSLVWAPQSEANRFDDLGCLIAEEWQDVSIPLTNAIDVVETPVDQAAKVVERARALADQGIRPEEVFSVALGDETMGPTVERFLEVNGIKARRSAGRSAASTGPALVLKSIGQFLANRTPNTLAALLRQPDIANYLRKIDRNAVDWIAALDAMCAEYLPAKLDCNWEVVAAAADAETANEQVSKQEQIAGETRARNSRSVLSAIKACDNLTSCLTGASKTIPEWSKLIGKILVDVYSVHQLNTIDPHDSTLLRALQAVAGRLERQQEVSPTIASAVTMTAPDAIRFTLQQLTNTPVPDPGEEMAVEVSGWLDAPLDDIPVLAVAGLNEGFLPQSVSSDAFLPNRMRSELGLVDNKARFARDAYLLTAVSHSRGENLILITCRKTVDGDPLRPSRLMFACDDNELVKRAITFYGNDNVSATARPLIDHGSVYSLAKIPMPLPLTKPIEKISVTAFKDYLACPYRFYLNRVVRLDAPSEDCEEMDGAVFGSLAHDVLRRFADSAIKDSQDVDEIRDFLNDAITDAALDQFGNDPLPAVAIQIRQLRRRLDRFAHLQAGWAVDGWEIEYWEQGLEMEVKFGDFSTVINGKIDRIDYKAATNEYRIMDYKTGDTAKTPEQTHRKRVNGLATWVDLQLPLYMDLFRSLQKDPASVSVGYVLLPKSTDVARFELANWDEYEYEAAYDLRDQVVRDIHDEKFWPPSDSVPTYSDGFETICMDRCPDRPAIIEDSDQLMAEWRPAKQEGAK